MGFFPPQGTMRPQSPPPNFKPTKPSVSYVIDCVYQNTYVWLRNGREFWFYPTRIEMGEVSGYRWNGAYWAFYGFDEGLIDAVACYPTPTLY
ncbi:transporter [Lysinibacillus xylanilyticus]|nr:transporter [Lysinibacillus xylanilyticus]